MKRFSLLLYFSGGSIWQSDCLGSFLQTHGLYSLVPVDVLLYGSDRITVIIIILARSV